MREHFRAIAAFNRERSLAMGIERYRWMAVDVHGCCQVAARNGGKVFAYDNPPPDGHPSEGACDSPDWCRCIAQAVIPGFDEG